MARGAQGNRAASDARGSPSRSHYHRGNRIFSRNPRPSTVDWGAGRSDRCPPQQRYQRAVATFARTSNGGLIVTADPAAIVHREAIIMLAARHRLPAIYPYRFFVTGGGLVSYGLNNIEQFRLAAGYVDRIVRGAKPADLPVQAPTRYETTLNLRTAKALGLTVPDKLLVAADEVIE